MRYPVVLLIPALVIGVSLYSTTTPETVEPSEKGEALCAQWCQDCNADSGRDFIERS